MVALRHQVSAFPMTALRLSTGAKVLLAGQVTLKEWNHSYFCQEERPSCLLNREEIARALYQISEICRIGRIWGFSRKFFTTWEVLCSPTRKSFLVNTAWGVRCGGRWAVCSLLCQEGLKQNAWIWGNSRADLIFKASKWSLVFSHFPTYLFYKFICLGNSEYMFLLSFCLNLSCVEHDFSVIGY